MLGRAFQFLLIAPLVAQAPHVATDPFVGRWNVSAGKSRLTDEMKIEAAGARGYIITFGPGAVDTIVPDRGDQPAVGGTVLSITTKGSNRWTVVRKKQGRTLLSADWTLSADGKTLADEFTGYQTDGTKLIMHYPYQRTGGTSGLAGTWNTENAQIESGMKLQIQPYDRDGLSVRDNGLLGELTRAFKFDGNDYPDTGADVPTGLTSSGRRVNERTVEITRKFKGRITGIQQIELSADLKVLTLSIRPAGANKPTYVVVFARE